MSQTATAAPLAPPLYGPDHSDFRDSFKTFLEREVRPAYAEWRAAGAIPPELLGVAGEHGFMGMRVPEEHGGAGVPDPRFGAIVGEEAMLAGAPALALVMTLHNDVALPAILRGAPDEWKRARLPAMAQGDATATVLSGEHTSDGDRVSGGAPMAPSAGSAAAFVAVARPAEGAGPAVVLIDRDADGVVVEPAEPTLGLDAAGLAAVRLDGAEAIPIGGPDEAAQLEADHALSLAITAAAGARAALSITAEYVTERRAFGVPIAEFQNTRRMLGGVAADLEMADAFVDRSLRRRTDGSLDATAAAAGKLFCTELLGRAVDAGLQLHGGYGYIMEYEIAHAFADARLWRLTGGTSQQMLDSIGGTVLRDREAANATR